MCPFSSWPTPSNVNLNLIVETTPSIKNDDRCVIEAPAHYFNSQDCCWEWWLTHSKLVNPLVVPHMVLPVEWFHSSVGNVMFLESAWWRCRGFKFNMNNCWEIQSFVMDDDLQRTPVSWWWTPWRQFVYFNISSRNKSTKQRVGSLFSLGNQ